jgi:hypothetical protein
LDRERVKFVQYKYFNMQLCMSAMRILELQKDHFEKQQAWPQYIQAPLLGQIHTLPVAAE